MANFVVNGGKALSGEIEVDACKNAILPIMAGSILCKGIVKIKHCPMYTDVIKMCDILKRLKSKITYKNNVLTLDNRQLSYAFISTELTKDIRASIFTLGPMLARFKKAKLSYPGGCAIGQRGISTHTNSFKHLGVEILEQHGYLYCKTQTNKNKKVVLDIKSVGATENIMMFMSMMEGDFEIYNCAMEPEIVDLANFLNKMGAKITGAGTENIKVTGVKTFKGVVYKPMPDRIIAGTYMLAGAITKGKIKIKNCNYEHIEPLCKILLQAGVKIKKQKNVVLVDATKKELNFSGCVETKPYPLFPTDLQSQLTTFLSVCNGRSCVIENIFECRFRYVPELIKMGAKLNVVNNKCFIEGKNCLLGADVYASDLRGGVALVLAGLCAKGYTTIYDIEHIDRGYYELEEKLKKIGADIKRVE